MLTIPTDCPQRDERLGWTGDIAIFAATSTFNLDMQAFLDKFTDDLADAQRADGAFTDVAPGRVLRRRHGGLGRRGRDRAVHAVAALRRPARRRRALRRDGALGRLPAGHVGRRPDPQPDDVRRLAQRQRQHRAGPHLDGVLRVVGAAGVADGRGHRADRGGGVLRHAGRPGRGRVHRAGSSPPTARCPATPRPGTCWRWRSVSCRRTGSQAGRPTSWSPRWPPPAGTSRVGFLGVENLLPVLADNGHADTAYQILLQPGFPGWGYMISRGATTIWERWDGIRTDGSFNDPGMNSFNHYGLGSVGDFLYRRVGGLGAGGARLRGAADRAGAPAAGSPRRRRPSRRRTAARSATGRSRGRSSRCG